MPRGAILAGNLVVSVALCCAATGFGVFIASVGRTQGRIEEIATWIILVMSAISGSWFPVDLPAIPKWIHVASHFTLYAWAVDAYHMRWWKKKSVVEVRCRLLSSALCERRELLARPQARHNPF